MIWFRIFFKLSVSTLLFISVLLAGVYYVVKYDKGTSVKSEIKTIQNKIKNEKKAFAKLELKLEKIKKLDIHIKQLGGDINSFLKYIPNKMTGAKMSKILTQKAKESGINIESLTNHGTTIKENFYEKIKVSIVIRGFFSQILLFLSKLTELTEILTVEFFDMQIAQKTKNRFRNSNQEIEARLDVYGFRYISKIIEKDIHKQIKGSKK